MPAGEYDQGAAPATDCAMLRQPKAMPLPVPRGSCTAAFPNGDDAAGSCRRPRREEIHSGDHSWSRQAQRGPSTPLVHASHVGWPRPSLVRPSPPTAAHRWPMSDHAVSKTTSIVQPKFHKGSSWRVDLLAFLNVSEVDLTTAGTVRSTDALQNGHLKSPVLDKRHSNVQSEHMYVC